MSKDSNYFTKFPTSEELQNISEEEIQKEIREFFKEKIIKKRILEEFSKAFSEIEKEERRVADVVIDDETFYLLKTFATEFDLNIECRKTTCDSVGTLWGADIWVDKCNKIQEIKCFSEESEAFRIKFTDFYYSKYNKCLDN